MTEHITLRQWRENYNAGAYRSKDFKTQCDAGWYDWFCEDEELAGRLEKFGRLADMIASDSILDGYRVWFKNNCPCTGPLYDDMRFEPLDGSRRDELHFVVSIDECRGTPYDGDRYKVYTSRTGYNIEYSANDVATVAKWIDESFMKEGEE